MKIVIKRLSGMVLLILAVLMLFPVSAQASKVRRLCYVTVAADGNGETQKIPLYEYSSKTKTSVAFKKSKRSVSLSPEVKKLTIRVSGKTSWFKKNYKSVSCAKELVLKKTKILRLKVRNNKGKLYRPAIRFGMAASDSRRDSQSQTVSQDQKDQTVSQNQTGQTAAQAQNTRGDSGDQTDLSAEIQSPDGQTDAASSEAGQPDIKVLTDATSAQAGTDSGSSDSSASADNGSSEGTASAESGSADGGSTQDGGSALSGTQADWPWTMTVTGNSSIDYVAELICREVLTPDMTQIRRAKALHDYIAVHYTYGSISGWDSKKDVYDLTSSKHKKAIKAYAKKTEALLKAQKAVKQVNDAYLSGSNSGLWLRIALEGMNNQIGDCYVIGNNYEVLCRHAGIDADILEHAEMGQAGHHYWNAVKIGKKYYMVDVDRPVQAGGSMLGYVFFLRGTKFMAKTAPYQTLNSSETYSALMEKMSKTDCKGRIIQ